MWRATINNGVPYGSNFDTQPEQQNANLYSSEFNDINLMRPNGNVPMDNFQHFNTEGTINYHPNAVFPVQGGMNAMFTPQMVQQPYNSGFINEVQVARPQSFYGAVLGHRQNDISTDFEVDDEAMLRSEAIGFPPNTNMYYDEKQYAVKRKAEEDYSPLYTGVKRRITDEHMATGMNSLYITNDHNYCANEPKFNPDNNLLMQFSTMSDDVQDGDDNIDRQERREHPVFQFAAPLEEMLKKKNDILPPQVIQEIYKPCLAMVPWMPSPLHRKQTHTNKRNLQTHVKKATSTSDEMEDESLIL